MKNNNSSIVSKVWYFCNPLRYVCLGYGDYLINIFCQSKVDNNVSLV